MSNHPTIAALKAKIDSNLENECKLISDYSEKQGYKNGNQDLAERLLPLIEKLIVNYEKLIKTVPYNSVEPDYLKEHREFLTMVTDAGVINKEDK